MAPLGPLVVLGVESEIATKKPSESFLAPPEADSVACCELCGPERAQPYAAPAPTLYYARIVGLPV